MPSPIKSSKPNASELSSNVLKSSEPKSSESNSCGSTFHELNVSESAVMQAFEKKRLKNQLLENEQLTKNPMFTALRLLNDSPQRPIVIKTIISYSV